MATVEFFNIRVKDKKTNKELEDFDFSKLLQDKLSNTADAMKYCTHGTRFKCSASIGDYKKGRNNITFDLTKFQEKLIKSALVSEFKLEEDTLKILHDKSVENAKYNDNDIMKVKNIINASSLNLFEITKKLKELSPQVNKFSIYKIIINEHLNKKEENNFLSDLFYNEVLKRLTTNKTFFNILSYSKARNNILLMEKNASGFTFTHLADYFNDHLLKDEKYKVSIDYEYDKDFISILENEKLYKFQFSLDLETSSLNEKKISPEFEELFLKHFGKTKVTISINPLDENDILNNKKIVNFFNLAKDEGLISSVVKISKKNNKQKNIKSTSKGDTLQYTTKTKNANNLSEAHNLFQIAIQKNFKLPY